MEQDTKKQNPFNLQDYFIVQMEKIKSKGVDPTEDDIKNLRDFYFEGCLKVYQLYEHWLHSVDPDDTQKFRQYIYNQLAEKRLEDVDQE